MYSVPGYRRDGRGQDDNHVRHLKKENGVRILLAADDVDLGDVRTLICEYIASLNVDLGSQGVEEELATMPGKYAGPLGTLLLARDVDGKALGCLGLRPLQPRSCEIKRLYVRPEARGRGIGRTLVKEGIRFAKSAKYHGVLLDSLPNLTEALALYRSLGFVEIPPYWDNPLPDILYFRKRLRVR